MSAKKTVRFKAWQDGSANTFEFDQQMVSATASKQFGHTLHKFFAWYDLMKKFKVQTGFSGKEAIYFSLTVNGRMVVDLKSLATRFKSVTKFKLNKTSKSKRRFAALAWGLFELALTFDETTTKAAQEMAIEKLLDRLTVEAMAEDAIKAERKAEAAK